jgi:hypothetical protein
VKRSLPLLRNVMLWLLILSIVCFIAGITVMIFQGDNQYNQNFTASQVSVGPFQADNTRINLEVGSGSINISSGNGKEVLHGSVASEIKSKPNLSASIDHRNVNIAISRTPDLLLDLFDSEENWNLNLGKSENASMKLSLGNGDINLTPGDVELNDLWIELGAGSIYLDLTGWEKVHAPIRIETGIGDVFILFPENSTIAVDLNQGVGDINISGFITGEHGYYHDTTSGNGSIMDVTISQGMGDLTMMTVKT